MCLKRGGYFPPQTSVVVAVTTPPYSTLNITWDMICAAYLTQHGMEIEPKNATCAACCFFDCKEV